jgi:hypothetical protein
VQYYGGEKQGGIKRLSSLDDETDVDDINEGDTIVSSESALPADTGLNLEAQNLTPTSTAPQAAKPTQTLHEVPRESRPQRTLSSVKDVSREDSLDTKDPLPRPEVEEVEIKRTPIIQQVDDSKGTNVPNLSVETTRSSNESDTSAPSFESWSKRWSPWLKRGGSIKVCEAFFRLTYVKGSAECFTSNSEIMRLTELSRAQCIRNIHYLMEMGFLDELDEVNNREAKGTYYRFNLVPKQLITP